MMVVELCYGAVVESQHNRAYRAEAISCSDIRIKMEIKMKR